MQRYMQSGKELRSWDVGHSPWDFAGWARVALDWAALERVLATKELGAKF